MSHGGEALFNIIDLNNISLKMYWEEISVGILVFSAITWSAFGLETFAFDLPQKQKWQNNQLDSFSKLQIKIDFFDKLQIKVDSFECKWDRRLG